MIILKEYQSKAVNSLIDDSWILLKNPNRQQKMVLKAPTGSGKTVMMANYMSNVCEEVKDKLELKNRKIAFIWFAPNQLHIQSYNSIKNYFDNLRTISPIQFEDITENKLHENEVLFVNWQSVNKEKNVFVRENEQGQNLINFVNNTYADDVEIICILDEAHYHANGTKAKKLLNEIDAKIEMDVSATPIFKSDYGHTIRRYEVIEEEMIKKNVVLNPALDHHKQKNISLDQYLLNQALSKRDEIAKAYKKLGIDINPLLLIQLPNDTKKESVLDKQKLELLEDALKLKGYTTDNNRVAIWLSNRKDNLEDIENQNSITDVLIFKQAIALGWDCPRSAILLIFREINQESFGIQTVGRILRMPQQKHYSDGLLNNGYVFTNLSKNLIQIVQEDMDYIVQNKALRIPTYRNIELNSSFINTRLVRNRLSSQFRKCLYQASEKYFNVNKDLVSSSFIVENKKRLQEKFIELDVDKIEIPIPKDIEFALDDTIIKVDNVERFAKTSDELYILFRQFCRNNIGGYAKVDSTPILELALISFFEDYLAIDETPAIKIMLFEQNKTKFIELIDIALQIHVDLLKQKALKATKKVENSVWEVPAERIYNEHYQGKQNIEKHALVPFYEQHNASNPEIKFAEFLELNKNHIEWWYKNGDKNKEDFAVTYYDVEASLKGFYVDFVIKLKNNKIYLFDTKTKGSDKNFIHKHNALIDYLIENTTSNKELLGGIIIPEERGNDIIWKYSAKKIQSATDSSGWKSFEPSIE